MVFDPVEKISVAYAFHLNVLEPEIISEKCNFPINLLNETTLESRTELCDLIFDAQGNNLTNSLIDSNLPPVETGDIVWIDDDAFYCLTNGYGWKYLDDEEIELWMFTHESERMHLFD